MSDAPADSDDGSYELVERQTEGFSAAPSRSSSESSWHVSRQVNAVLELPLASQPAITLVSPSPKTYPEGMVRSRSCSPHPAVAPQHSGDDAGIMRCEPDIPVPLSCVPATSPRQLWWPHRRARSSATSSGCFQSSDEAACDSQSLGKISATTRDQKADQKGATLPAPTVECPEQSAAAPELAGPLTPARNHTAPAPTSPLTHTLTPENAAADAAAAQPGPAQLPVAPFETSAPGTPRGTVLDSVPVLVSSKPAPAADIASVPVTSSLAEPKLEEVGAGSASQSSSSDLSPPQASQPLPATCSRAAQAPRSGRRTRLPRALVLVLGVLLVTACSLLACASVAQLHLSLHTLAAPPGPGSQPQQAGEGRGGAGPGPSQTPAAAYLRNPGPWQAAGPPQPTGAGSSSSSSSTTTNSRSSSSSRRVLEQAREVQALVERSTLSRSWGRLWLACLLLQLASSCVAALVIVSLRKMLWPEHRWRRLGSRSKHERSSAPPPATYPVGTSPLTRHPHSTASLPPAAGSLDPGSLAADSLLLPPPSTSDAGSHHPPAAPLPASCWPSSDQTQGSTTRTTTRYLTRPTTSKRPITFLGRCRGRLLHWLGTLPSPSPPTLAALLAGLLACALVINLSVGVLLAGIPRPAPPAACLALSQQLVVALQTHEGHLAGLQGEVQAAHAAVAAAQAELQHAQQQERSTTAQLHASDAALQGIERRQAGLQAQLHACSTRLSRHQRRLLEQEQQALLVQHQLQVQVQQLQQHIQRWQQQQQEQEQAPVAAGAGLEALPPPPRRPQPRWLGLPPCLPPPPVAKGASQEADACCEACKRHPPHLPGAEHPPATTLPPHQHLPGSDPDPPAPSLLTSPHPAQAAVTHPTAATAAPRATAPSEPGEACSAQSSSCPGPLAPPAPTLAVQQPSLAQQLLGRALAVRRRLRRAVAHAQLALATHWTPPGCTPGAGRLHCLARAAVRSSQAALVRVKLAATAAGQVVGQAGGQVGARVVAAAGLAAGQVQSGLGQAVLVSQRLNHSMAAALSCAHERGVGAARAAAVAAQATRAALQEQAQQAGQVAAARLRRLSAAGGEVLQPLVQQAAASARRLASSGRAVLQAQQAAAQAAAGAVHSQVQQQQERVRRVLGAGSWVLGRDEGERQGRREAGGRLQAVARRVGVQARSAAVAAVQLVVDPVKLMVAAQAHHQGKQQQQQQQQQQRQRRRQAGEEYERQQQGPQPEHSSVGAKGARAGKRRQEKAGRQHRGVSGA
ncbi:hypothetical protein V8C86DRAFT_274762 [Haematococcus lacustris]